MFCYLSVVIRCLFVCFISLVGWSVGCFIVVVVFLLLVVFVCLFVLFFVVTLKPVAYLHPLRYNK